MRDPHNEALTDHDIAKRGVRREASERRCVLSGRGGERDAFLRLALSPANEDGESEILPDALARAPGRGAWIGTTRDELAAALISGRLKAALARAFKTGKLSIPADLPELTEKALLRAFLDRLGLEMRAGRLILGSDRIGQEARMGRVAALYHAADASDDGARKLDQALRVGMDAEGSGLAGMRLPLDRATLSMALGRNNVVHMALADAGSAERVAVPLQRLMNFVAAANPGGDPEISGEKQVADDVAPEEQSAG